MKRAISVKESPNWVWHMGWLALLLLCSRMTLALDIYQAEVSVRDQTADARVEALGRALLEVAVKASGDASASSNATVIAAQSSAERYMQRYAYRQAIVRENGAPAIKLFLTGTFYPNSIQQLLQRAGLAVWGRERPSIAVYLFEGEAPLSQELRTAMQERSARRGLQLRFPGGISSADLSDPESLGQRLASPGTHALFGRVNEQIYLSDGRSTEALSSAALDGLSDRLAQTMARRSAIAANAPPETVVVSVLSIRSAANYAGTMKYLSGMSAVKSVKVLGARLDGLTLELSVKGGAAQLAQSIAQGDTLRVLSESPLQLELAY
jgi:hypothetical protein